MLPEVDDGAPDLEAATLMAAGLAEIGFHTVAASPHAGGGPGGDVPPEIAQRERRRLQTALTEKNIGIRLLPNAEHHLLADLLDRAESDRLVPIGGCTHWLLVELPWVPPAMLDALVFRLQARGYRLLLAHPERHSLDDARLLSWVAAGLKTQAELGSFVGVYGGVCAHRAFSLVEHGMVHVLASDLHRPQDLQRWVAAGIGSVESHFGRDVLRRALSENPAAILEDAAVADIPPLVDR